MDRRVWVVFLLLIGSAFAQFADGTLIRVVRVRVAFTNGVCELSTHVRLVGIRGPLAEGIANDRCEVQFMNIPAGRYHLIVSGQNFGDVDSGDVAMDAVGSNEFEVKVTHAGQTVRAGDTALSPFVSTADLGIPAKAQKEFDKATGFIAKQDFAHAMERLNKAIAIYPPYAGAYNNLGVIYSRLGDHEHERAELQKAIALDDHFAPAHVNLGRLDLTTGDFAGAESEFTKAAAADPMDGMALVLLSFASLENHHFDQAIAASKHAHMLPSPHAFAHQLAARAYEQKRDGASAVAELELFLKEEPAGPRADGARKELAAVKAILAGSASTSVNTASAR